MGNFEDRMKMTYEYRASLVDNSAAKKLFELMNEKKSNLALANDDLKFENFLPLIEKVGDELVVVKTHVDTLRYPSFDEIGPLIRDLVLLSDKYGFMIFEDRKFADIGHVVKEQYTGGAFNIAEWAHFVNAHSISGPGIIEGLYEGAKPFIEKGEDRGLIILAQMTPEGNLFTPEYTENTIKMSEPYPEFVVGFIGTGSQPGKLKNELASKANPRFIIATPGIRFGKTEGDLRQRYAGPENAVCSGSDLLIVGGGIYKAEDPLKAAQEYKKVGWDAYQQRQRR